MKMPERCEVAVIGAGAVGVATALWLRRQGYHVVLLERDAVAAGASYGNAGTFAPYGCMPIAQPGLLRDIPRLLFSADSPFVVRWSRLPRLMPWLARFLNQCRPHHFQRNATALAQLLQHTYEGYAPLLDEAPLAEKHLRHKGCIYAYSSLDSLRGAEGGYALRDRFGIPQQRLSRDELEALEPALAGKTVGGILFPKSSHLDDPKRFFEDLAAPLLLDGTLCFSTVQRLVRRSNALQLDCANGHSLLAERVVLCGGAWSAALAQQLGDRIPLDTERGYHIEFDLEDTLLERPCCPVESAFYMTPMAGRLRVAGTVELGSINDPANPKRYEYLEQRVRRVLGLRQPVARRWLGFRPSLPDSLPVIGVSPNEPRLIHAFGHQHLGLTLAGVTGQLVSQLIEGTAPAWLDAFSSRRF